MKEPARMHSYFPGRRVSGVRVTVGEIQRIVSAYFELAPGVLVSPTRVREVAWPRQMAMALAYRFSGLSHPQIGRRFGGRDHTTVMHALRMVEQRRADSDAYDTHMRRLEALVGASLPDFVRRDLARGMFRTRRFPAFQSCRGAGVRG